MFAGNTIAERLGIVEQQLEYYKELSKTQETILARIQILDSKIMKVRAESEETTGATTPRSIETEKEEASSKSIENLRCENAEMKQTIKNLEARLELCEKTLEKTLEDINGTLKENTEKCDNATETAKITKKALAEALIRISGYFLANSSPDTVVFPTKDSALINSTSQNLASATDEKAINSQNSYLDQIEI